MLEEEKSKVAKLEQILANKENQVGQLESVLAQSKLLKPLSIKMVEKIRYRERKLGINFFDVQSSLIKIYFYDLTKYFR